jgi:hypothetical protein
MEPEQMLKGRMAETLVEELLKKSKNNVYRFGYEAILQNLSQIQKSFDRHSHAGERLRSIPDFIVINEQGNPVFLEVKFRGDGKLHDHDYERLQRIKDFWEAEIIFVNCTKKPYFQISSPPYFNPAEELVCQPLEEVASWNIDSEAYKQAEILVEKYLSKKLLNNGQTD